MTPGALIGLLGWACYLGAAVAIVAYVVVLIGQQMVWRAAGLLLTAIALTQAPTLFREAYYPHALRAAALLTGCLLAAVAAQIRAAASPAVKRAAQ